MPAVLKALARLAAIKPHAPAFSDPQESLTYAALAARVEALAARLHHLPPGPVGLLCSHGIAWPVAELALARAGRTLVPLPEFFSPGQLAHVAADAGIGLILTTPPLAAAARALGRPVALIIDPEAPSTAPVPDVTPCLRRIVYTSGSTGQPKGVVLDSQVEASAQALLAASEAGPKDRYLSVLPLALLLEQICAIHLPLLAGAPVHLAPGIAAAAARTDPQPLLAALAQTRPTALVLVPELLALWVGTLEALGQRAPDTLRFVAVGGAPVPVPLADRAWDLGIPVHEGYGLTECCSVVALNRPGQHRPGSAGVPLPGVNVTIEGGEIVVRGPTVMEGYLHGAPAQGCWRTGDLGDITADGALAVLGRKDNLLVTANGRNISPEWVETAIGADPRLRRVVVFGHGTEGLSALLVPAAPAEAWFKAATPEMIRALMAPLVAGLPEYARPRQFLFVAESELAAQGLLTGNGRPRRPAIAERYSRASSHHE